MATLSKTNRISLPYLIAFDILAYSRDRFLHSFFSWWYLILFWLKGKFIYVDRSEHLYFWNISHLIIFGSKKKLKINISVFFQMKSAKMCHLRSKRVNKILVRFWELSFADFLKFLYHIFIKYRRKLENFHFLCWNAANPAFKVDLINFRKVLELVL